MAIRYYNEDCKYILLQKRITAQWVGEIVSNESYILGDVNYIFCSAKRLLEMNNQYLEHNYYTDVITFDYSDLEGSGIISGDIFIDVETVKDNALVYKNSYISEMRRVVAHGALHLCGQGDKSLEASVEMRAKEDKYLRFWDDK